ncbi:MAG: phosphatidylglycerophosphatase A [Planctomycetales bacterium]|nr:phosphatidylglycerophosphatase A [Planctomycetales bacterium]
MHAPDAAEPHISSSPSRPPSANAAVWLATGLGVGLVAPAPGTVGSLWGVPVALALGQWNNAWGQGIVLALFAAMATSVCQRAAEALGSDDPGSVVLDEIVALPMVFLGLGALDWRTLATGFVLFRVFDIWKPGPVKLGERLPGGIGVVADDVLAALLSLLTMHLLSWLGWWELLHRP